MKLKHDLGPYRVEPGSLDTDTNLPMVYYILANDGDSSWNCIASTFHRKPNIKQNAEYIVTACNAFPDLVAALEKIANDFDPSDDGIKSMQLMSNPSKHAAVYYMRSIARDALDRIKVQS